jgi:hypothetical protein
LQLAVGKVRLVFGDEGPHCVGDFDFHGFSFGIEVVGIKREVENVSLE